MKWATKLAKVTRVSAPPMPFGAYSLLEYWHQPSRDGLSWGVSVISVEQSDLVGKKGL